MQSQINESMISSGNRYPAQPDGSVLLRFQLLIK